MRRTTLLMEKHLQRALFIKRKCRIEIPTPDPDLGALSRHEEVSSLKGTNFGRSVLILKSYSWGRGPLGREPSVTEPCSKQQDEEANSF